MLVLTRKSGEEIFINDDIRIVVREIRGKQIRIGIEAPPSVTVYRGEIYREVQTENRRAAASDLDEAEVAAQVLSQISFGKTSEEE